MVDNFRGVLIFITFVIDLAVTKIPPMIFNAYVYVDTTILCKYEWIHVDNGRDVTQ